MAKQRGWDDLEVEDATESVQVSATMPPPAHPNMFSKHKIHPAPSIPTEAVHKMPPRFSGHHVIGGADHSHDHHASSAIELVLTEFRKSDFLRFISHLVQNHSRETEQQIAQLRCENGHLRKQLVAAQQAGSPHSPATPQRFQVTNTVETKNRQDSSEFDLCAIPCAPTTAALRRAITNSSDESTTSVLHTSQGIEGGPPSKPSNFTKDSSKVAASSQIVMSYRQTVMSHRVTNVMPDIDRLKDSIRAAVIGKSYNVAQYYNLESKWATIATHPYFEYITLMVIAVNSIWIAIDTDNNEATTLVDADLVFQIVEYTFFTFFTTELFIRFRAFDEKSNCLSDFWFVFDSTMVLLMLMDLFALPLFSGFFSARDTSVLKLLRITRLTRMARMARLLRALPELVILIKGIFVAAKSVFFTLCLLTILIYVFAIIFVQATDGLEIKELYFRSVPYSMKSLLLYATLPDMAEMVDNVGDEHGLLAVILLIFILLASLTVMNMLVGVLVEVVSAVSEVEREELKVTYVKNTLLDMLQKQHILSEDDMMISRKEFEMLLIMPDAARVIQDVGVDPVGLVDFTDHIFDKAGQEGLSFPDFINLMLQLRGSNGCTVRDIVGLRKTFLEEFMAIQHVLNVQSNLIENIRSNLPVGNSSSKTTKSSKTMEDASQTQVDSLKPPAVGPSDNPPTMWAFKS